MHQFDETSRNNHLDLYILDTGLSIEELPDASAPAGCWFSAASGSTASCPGSSAATASSASSFSG